MTNVMEKDYEVVHLKPWQPNKPISRGAIAYHEAVANADYYLESLDKLMSIIAQKIKDGDIVVDYGAGTGVSAMYMLKRLKANIKLWLVDNSPAWLGKAYDIFHKNPNVECFILEKNNEDYATLCETIGEQTADHVISANTVHLIPNLEYTFKGINLALKPNGTFTFQSGNITRRGRKKGVLMVDDTVKRVHDIAMEIVKENKKYKNYREIIKKQIEPNKKQQNFVFPEPRPLEYYLASLKSAYFKYAEPYYKLLRIAYKDWMEFLRVKRLQAGILPEIGGINPSPQEEKDRDELITMSANQLFKELERHNPMSDDKCFTVELVYVTATKQH